MKEYCPDCIEPLVKNKKKLGNLTIWWICPKCGFRKRAKGWWEESKELDRFEEYKKITNANKKVDDE